MKVKIKNYEYLDSAYRGYSQCYIKTETVIETPDNGKICIANWNKKTLTVGIHDGNNYFTKELSNANFEIILE